MTQEEKLPKEAEWSEEDEDNRLAISKAIWEYDEFLQGDAIKLINWLKSLRPQPKRNCKECAMFLGGECTRPHWKPSEGQIKALELVVNFLKPRKDTYEPKKVTELESLYEQLKKL